ncbi:Glutamine amidotransferase-like class 1 domain-containing protein 3A, mitochondrial,Glutamine amidotransferase-like class 1 domain-containing protein 3B, mitochondrial,ES1 protein homolog, mitochondrial [Mytilus edulis]|uniref:C1q domain-containing protein n=1 Tax=Mytilus edulis TaxID=6550 RepID=A0A8S3Q3B4_MYTED|nr:Glutamine amidotransferase-like class 1 domain-containing protein 3A, mitochondrial,Glutamine amidotransferase-like class 1 domain-containing protein 3B, mitochondrial,ES1 protein homolog, mitochondrial [Mytilus edulis]
MFKKIKGTGIGLSQHDKVFSAFAASLTASKTLGHGEIVKFDKVWTNVNNDYDPITGVYTSPEPGVYQFSCSVMTQKDKQLRVYLWKNKKRTVAIYAGYPGYNTGTLNMILDLAKGDKVLSGCGVYDGTEVHEASAILVHLSRNKADVSMFAPDIEQMHAIDHTKGEPMPTNRSNFAVDGANMKVNSDVERIIQEFHKGNKPIGLCCIAPVLAAKLIHGCEVTVGSDQEEGGKWPYAGTAAAITTMGASHQKKDVTDVHVDEKNRIITTPAYMCETALHEIFDGIGKMVTGVLKLTK